MGRKRKSIIELTKPSYRVKKSRLNAKPLAPSYQLESIIENETEIEENRENNSALESLITSENEIIDSHEESFDEQLNIVERVENSQSDSNVGTFVGSVLRKHCVQYNMGRICLSSMLKDLKSRFPDLPSDYRTLLKTPRTTEIRIVSPGEYVHLGILKNLQKLVTNCDKEIIIDIFIDGFAIYRDTVLNSFWIILGRLGKNIFPIGIYNGVSKPKDFNDFLLDFCIESKELMTSGINNGQATISFRINNILLDSPAKSHVTYTKYHTGYGSCYYCDIFGYHDGSRVCFLETDCSLRTNSNFENQTDKKFHKGTSILQSSLRLKMIDQIPIDYLHCVLLGVMKKMLIKFFVADRPLLTSVMKDKVSKSLIFTNDFLCSEIHRKFRDLKHIKTFHGNELRIFLLKIGCIVLKNNVPNEIYNNFLLLHIAISILCDPNLCLTKNSFADYCLKLFIRDAIEIYGTEIATSVLHDLQHLPKMVLKYQLPLDSFSTFPFENYLLKLKDMVHTNNNPLPQIHRRIEEMISYEKKEEKNEYQKNEFHFIYSKSSIVSVFMKNFKISVNGCRDRVVMCNKKSLYVCVGIKKGHNGEPVLKARKLKVLGDFYALPVNSTKLDIFECATSYVGPPVYLNYS